MGDDKLKFLSDKAKTSDPQGDISVLEKAYDTAQKLHQNSVRKSGEPYFNHCYEVAKTVADFNMDIAVISSALLHDTLEDTDYSAEQMRKDFGEEITALVEGVTKIKHLNFTSRDEEMAENWRKMILAIAKDVRVVLIKLADRLHNMQTIAFIPPGKQKIKAHETLSLYAPLSQRLGMFNLKSQLEDLSFKTLEPEVYSELSVKLEKLAEKRQTVLEMFKTDLQKNLSSLELKYRVLARRKNIYSIYRKMQKRNLSFEEIQDVLGARVIVDSIADCYGVLGVIHSAFKPVAGTFTDYIALPKANLYKSIHTTVVTDRGEIVEVQIRTEEMHRICEYGIAAHWRYKLGGSKDPHMEEKLDWFRKWIEWLQDLTNPREFLDTFKTDMDIDQIFIFTPKGDVQVLPFGATILDFAYAVHTEIGEHCAGAKVNNKMVPLDHKLKNGDFCEIFVRKNQTPKNDWLKIAATARALSKIRHYLREHAK